MEEGALAQVSQRVESVQQAKKLNEFEELTEAVKSGVKKIKDESFVQDAINVGTEYTEKVAANVKKMKKAPRWTMTLIMTDWVSLGVMAPIIAGMVVFLVFLASAQQDFLDILNLMGATGGLVDLITAYSIFIGVTIPLVAVALAYALSMVLVQCCCKVQLGRNEGMSKATTQKRTLRNYRIIRWSLVVLMGLEYIELMWLIVCMAATTVLLCASYACEAGANSAISLYGNAIETWNGHAETIRSMNGAQLMQAAYQNNVTVNGEVINLGDVLNAVAYSALNSSTLTNPTSVVPETVCPSFCLNTAFLVDMLNLESINTCICTPDVIYQIAELGTDAKGKLWNSLIGIIIMLLAWIILLMRLAATHDVLRVKHKLQTWLSSQGYTEASHHNGSQGGAATDSGSSASGTPMSVPEAESPSPTGKASRWRTVSAWARLVHRKNGGQSSAEGAAEV